MSSVPSLKQIAWPAAPAASVPPAALARSPGYSLGFFLVVVLTGTLYLRPMEIVPLLEGWPIYQVVILACLACSFPCLLRQLQPSWLEERPINLCMLGLLFAVILSHLSNAKLGDAFEQGLDVFKALLYYFLLVGLLSTPGRLRRFLSCLAGFILVLAILAVLNYHGVFKLRNIADMHVAGGDARLRSAGIFNDPNDLAAILNVGLMICLYKLTDRKGFFRLAWLGPLLFLGYAFALTTSRGGFLALVAGLAALFRSRYGWGKTLILGAIALPVLLVVFAGRMTTISTRETTGQSRIQLWSDGLMLFKQAPLFGVGHNTYATEIGLVAHNSYLHTYAELGFLGGTLFLGAAYLALWGTARLGLGGRRIVDPELRTLQPFLLGLLVAYATSMATLSLAFLKPTLVTLALAAAFVAQARCEPPLPPLRFNARLLQRLVLLSVAALAVLYVFVKIFVRWG